MKARTSRGPRTAGGAVLSRSKQSKWTPGHARGDNAPVIPGLTRNPFLFDKSLSENRGPTRQSLLPQGTFSCCCASTHLALATTSILGQAPGYVRLLLLVLAGFFSNVLIAQTPTDDPVSLVRETTGKIFANVAKNLEEYTANPAALQTLVRSDLMPLLDVDYAARLVLGRAGRGLDSKKIDEFAICMSNLLVDRYSKGLLYFSSEIKLQVLPQRRELNEKVTRVRTRVQLPNGGEAPVDYVFHKTPAGWKAFDVIVEGISYVTTYRNQIMPDVEANGIDSVIARLGSGDLKLAE